MFAHAKRQNVSNFTASAFPRVYTVVLCVDVSSVKTMKKVPFVCVRWQSQQETEDVHVRKVTV